MNGIAIRRTSGGCHSRRKETCGEVARVAEVEFDRGDARRNRVGPFVVAVDTDERGGTGDGASGVAEGARNLPRDAVVDGEDGAVPGKGREPVGKPFLAVLEFLADAVGKDEAPLPFSAQRSRKVATRSTDHLHGRT